MMKSIPWTIVTLAWLVPCVRAADVAVQITKDEQLDVLIDGKVATRYMYAHDTSTPERRIATFKPFLHVFDADGKRPITNGGIVGEYPHHRGIFIGWYKIKVGDKVYDRWHMKGGEIVHQKFTPEGAQVDAGAGTVTFTAINNWNDDANKPFLVEERTQRVSKAGVVGAPGRLVIDFTSKLTAQGTDVTLDGDPEHAGIHYRPADDTDRAKTVYLYPVENAQPHKDVDYPWVGATYTLKDGGTKHSVVEFNHPDNPKGTRWSAYRDYGRFGAFPVATVKAGQSITLKYRFLIADGEMLPVDAIEKCFDQFTGAAAPTAAPKTTVLPAEQAKPKAPAAPVKPAAAKPKAEKAKAEKPATAATTEPAKPKQAKTNRAGPEDPKILFPLPPPAPLKVEEALKTFVLPPGFRIEPVASEPMVESPIAMSFDERGRMYVVEMRSYMLDLANERENDPICRVKLLEDIDGDGVMDKSTVFLDKLVMPRAVMACRGGALVAEPPELALWEDTNGDGKADKKTIVATDYAKKGGQPEHMANTPIVALDNWIYSAAHPARYRLIRGKWTAEPARTRGQYGLAQDDYGRLYFNNNSDVGRASPLPSQYVDRNPFYKSRAGADVTLVTTQATWPSHPTPGVNRGYEKEQLREDGTLATATAASGSTIYRANLLGDDFNGNLFTPEPSGNLIKRLIVTDSGGKLAATNAYDGKEFLTSTDERFRPVQACTGPDGALYVIDMYQGILQHYYFVTHYLEKNIEDRELESPNNWGRIYRIVPDGKKVEPVKLPEKSADLVAFLAHPNGALRDTAQRLLVERNDRSVVPTLKKMAVSAPSPLGRLHALWTLEGLGRLDEQTTRKALADSNAKVRAAAIRLAEPLLVPTTRAQFLPVLLNLCKDSSADVQLQLVLSTGAIPEPAVEEMVAGLLTSSAADPDILRDAVFSGLRGRELEFAERLLARPAWATESPQRVTTLTELARCVMSERRAARVGRLVELAAQEGDNAWRQKALLDGAAPKLDEKGKLPSNVKLVYLDAAPDGLPALLANTDTTLRDLATRLDMRLAWPGKPGVPPPPVVKPLTSDEMARFDRGKAVYAQICGACHQPTGQGLEGLAPPLLDSEWALGSPQRVIRIVLQGVTGPISVNGAVYKGEMPGLATLPDADIAAALTYVRREWDHGGDPIDEPTVAKVRESTKARAELWTVKELQELK